MQGRLAVVLVVAMALSGCPGLEERSTWTTHFTSPGAFRAALATGGEVAAPRLDRAVTPLALRAPDLDEAWVAGHYTLTGVQWTPWVRSGPTEVNPQQEWELLLFEVVGGRLTVQHGYSPREVIRAPAHDFLENVTTLSRDERAAAVERLMAHAPVSSDWGEIHADLDLSGDIDATRAWGWSGGLRQMRGPVHDGYHEAGAWYRDSPGAAWRFRFVHGSATLEGGGWFGDDARAFVLPTDSVHFTWTTDGPQDDAAADEALRRLLRGTGIDVPPATELEWAHGLEED